MDTPCGSHRPYLREMATLRFSIFIEGLLHKLSFLQAHTEGEKSGGRDTLKNQYWACTVSCIYIFRQHHSSAFHY